MQWRVPCHQGWVPGINTLGIRGAGEPTQPRAREQQGMLLASTALQLWFNSLSVWFVFGVMSICQAFWTLSASHFATGGSS